jgi:hypothetical protein
MSNFNKSNFLAAIKPKAQPFDVEGFGPVSISQLTVAEVENLRAGMKNDGNTDQFGLRLVLMAVVDEDGAHVFDDTDLPALQSSANATLESLVGKALEVNGFKKADEKNA